MKMTIQLVDYKDILPLRARILKPHLKMEDCINPGDLRPDTFHLAAKVETTIVGIASFEFEAQPNLQANTPARLRGMAVSEDFRRHGIGQKLLLTGVEILRKKKSDLLWFNAREKAFPFYESLGFQYLGEKFDLPMIGPHKVMYKYLK